MSAIPLAWRLWRAGGRRGLTTSLLAVTASAVATGLLVLTVGVWTGFDARDDRTRWRTPAPATAGAVATAVQRTTTGAHAGRELVVVDLAATGAGQPAVPPGLPRFPSPGEVFVSPALADLVAELPAAQLGARFGAVTGELGAAALAHPEELVVVTGRAVDDAAMTAPAWRDLRRGDAHAGPTAVAGSTGQAVPDGRAASYTALASIGVVLLVVPLLVLAGAAARLGLARRDARLAALRLAGATPAQVLGVSALETGATAGAGALLGVAAAVLAAPVAALVPVGGGRWYPMDLVPPLPVVAVVAAGAVALAVGSAAVALRRVLAHPVGVAASTTPRRLSLLRAGLFVLLLVVFLQVSESDGADVRAVVLGFAGVFAALAVVGPWVVGLLGHVVVHRSRTTEGLLAGRRLLDDPRGAWRVVGAVAMTGFVAGVVALFPNGGGPLPWGEADRLDVAVPALAAGGDLEADLEGALAAAGVEADVRDLGSGRGALELLRTDGEDARHVAVSLAAPARDLEVARTVVAQLLPGAVAATGEDVVIADEVFAADFRTASVVVLGASFLVAMASAGTTALAGVLDRRRTYRQLALLGVPLPVLTRARVLETQVPLVVMAAGSALTGVVVASPVTRLGLGGAGLDLAGLALLVGCLVLGVLGVRAATAASGPLLARVAADPASTSD